MNVNLAHNILKHHQFVDNDQLLDVTQVSVLIGNDTSITIIDLAAFISLFQAMGMNEIDGPHSTSL